MNYDPVIKLYVYITNSCSHHPVGDHVSGRQHVGDYYVIKLHL